MDDLFAARLPEPLTVSQVNQRARLLLERQFASVTVQGEISGLRIVQGHHYFCLKDKESQLSAVLFRREAAASRLELEDGLDVLATGKLTIYAPQGRYQLIVERLERRGLGALQAAFEQLKQRLAADGLFAAERKRRLPLVPRRVAVVTSPTGAVIRDIVDVATRRFPKADILLVPTRVQGEEAAPQVAAAVARASGLAVTLGLDVIIVARGGGSLEDLWCFNDERVARAIAASVVPVVSAVGHETDFTIADFVADVRAPTPSAAAELVFPQANDLRLALLQQLARCREALGRDLGRWRLHVRALRAELGDARSLLRAEAQRLAQAAAAEEDALRRLLEQRRRHLHELDLRLARQHPRAHLTDLQARLRGVRERIHLSVRQRLERDRSRLESATRHLQALSPLGVLERGYAIVLSPGGQAVRAAEEVAAGERLHIQVARGAFDATALGPATQGGGK
jgi:exodeoxyribonuclease VII large subunit